MAKKLDTVWDIEEHTKAKHEILRRYLEAWLPIMSKANGRLIYIDGFSGPGVYTNGEPGSPIIALKAFLEHSYRQEIKAELIYVFIDEDPKRTAELEKQIEALGPLPTNVKVSVRTGAYEHIFSQVLDSLEQEGKELAPTFAFIDPFGYSQASMRLSGRFLQFSRCEALVYVPIRFIDRFVSLDSQDSALTTLFGTEEWKAARALKGDARRRFLHDLFFQQMKRECGLDYVRSFEIVAATPNSGYHLFFGTKHPLGLRRMKEAMWKLDPENGQKFRDSTSEKQQPLFQPEVDTKPLRDAMIERFGDQPVSIQELDNFALIETPYLPSHIRTRTLKPLEKDGRLIIVSAKPDRRRFTYPTGTVIRFVLQIPQ